MQYHNGHDSSFEFPIQGLDEYFAARHLSARWAEMDEKYSKWLPCSEDWWVIGTELCCPNPYCLVSLPPFMDLLQTANEGTLLLVVGILKSPEREHTFLSRLWESYEITLKVYDRIRATQDNTRKVYPYLEEGWSISLSRRLDSILKVLSRCRFGHLGIIEVFKSEILTHQNYIYSGLSALGKARSQQNVQPIYDHCLGALQNKHKTIRHAATGALGKLGIESAVPTLIRALKEKQIDIQEAASALQLLGDTGFAGLITMLRGRNQDVWLRAYVAQALGGTNTGLTSLWSLLTAKAADLRYLAAIGLAVRGVKDVSVIRQLIEALQDKRQDLWLREEVSHALCSIGDPVVEHLLPLLMEQDAQICGLAALSLGYADNLQVLSPLIMALNDKDAYYGRACVGEMAMLALNFVLDGVSSVDPGFISDTACDSLIVALRNEEPSIRTIACEILGKIGDVKMVAFVQPLLLIYAKVIESSSPW